MDYIEEIKAKLPIEDLVAEYVQLRKAGRNFKALSPFKQEKTPSFIISPDKGIAYCFATQQGGDIFKLIQLLEGVDFMEAVRILADKTGVRIPEPEKQSKLSSQKKKAEEVMEEALSFYLQEFQKSDIAKKYWQTRGIESKISKEFQIGFSPDSFTATYSFLKKKGYTEDQMLSAGLILEKTKTAGEYFDRFRARLMIPIKNHMGKTVGFGARLIADIKDQAKYLNSPDSALYNKSYVLFALDKSKEEIKKKDQVIILEGYMDVIASFQAGVRNVVAVSGTALTEEQLKLIKRYTSNIALAFDSDEAGREATKRSIELAVKHDFNIKVINFHEAKDADELIKQGADKWQSAIKNQVDPLDFYVADAKSRYDLSDPIGQKNFVSDLLSKISLFPNLVIQQNYLKKLAEILNLEVRVLIDEFERQTKADNSKQEESIQPSAQLSMEKYALGIILNYPDFVAKLKDLLIMEVFSDLQTKHIYKALLDNYNGPASSPLIDTLQNLDDNLGFWQIYAEEKNSALNEGEWNQEFLKLVREINLKNIKIRERDLISKMKSQVDREEQQKMAMQMMEINKLKKII